MNTHPEKLEAEISQLSSQEQAALWLSITENLKAHAQTNPDQKYSLMELDGLGKEIWQKINTNEYLNQLR